MSKELTIFISSQFCIFWLAISWDCPCFSNGILKCKLIIDGFLSCKFLNFSTRMLLSNGYMFFCCAYCTSFFFLFFFFFNAEWGWLFFKWYSIDSTVLWWPVSASCFWRSEWNGELLLLMDFEYMINYLMLGNCVDFYYIYDSQVRIFKFKPEPYATGSFMSLPGIIKCMI